MDATKVQKYVVGMIDLTDDEKFLYDTNGDNVLTVIDATNIQKIIVGSQFDTSEPSSLTETTSAYGTEASTESTKMTTENMKFTETTISDFSSACTGVTTEYTETTAYTETTTECVEETTIVDEPSTESTETTTEEVTEPSTESTETTTEEVTEQPTTEPKPTVPLKSVKFNKNGITLGVGESYTLITTIENGDISQVAFTTSDRKVATVDNNGKIIAAGTGTATITANTYNGLKTQCKVTVKKLANSIKLDKTSITLGIGEQYDFSSYVPSGTAAYFRSYYSDDPNIAFIQKAGGLMTAKKAGTTTVRCKMPNGTQATCNVTVKPLATSLKLNASEIVLYIGQSFDINSSVPKGTAAYYRLYSSSNSKIAAVTRGGGVVKGVATGKATVTCTLNNGKKAISNVYIMPQSKKISNVPLIGQSKLPTGCETCSATMLLKHYGYNISETTFADKYLVKKPFGYSNGSYTGPDSNCAFVGTPYSSNSYGAYAPIMVKCMNKYLSDKSYKAVEISGKSLEYLSGKYVAQGQPIMIWATINMLPSFKTTTWRVNYTDENAKYKLGSYYTWIAREHCLVMTGYDNYYYYFNDPWTNARTRYSKSLVNTRYNELGKQAVVMVKE
ncbi:MAG TPA: C39 family peptidase [Ruminococcus bromii]|nr:C39 family peptidase [Ruminococcus bromii]